MNWWIEQKMNLIKNTNFEWIFHTSEELSSMDSTRNGSYMVWNENICEALVSTIKVGWERKSWHMCVEISYANMYVGVTERRQNGGMKLTRGGGVSPVMTSNRRIISEFDRWEVRRIEPTPPHPTPSPVNWPAEQRSVWPTLL